MLSYSTEFGNISVESEKPDDLVEGLEKVKRIAFEIKRQETGPKVTHVPKVQSNKRRGRGETASILAEIESKLLPTEFFSTPKTTGETSDRLNRVTGRTYTSRKVSQALGILWKSRALKRKGKRNFFVYST